MRIYDYTGGWVKVDIYVMIYDRANLSAGSGEQPLPQLHMQRPYQYVQNQRLLYEVKRLKRTVNSGLPLLALPFFQGRICGHRCESSKVRPNISHELRIEDYLHSGVMPY